VRVAVSWRERFWKMVDKTPGFGPWGDCWRWTGLCDPYGRLAVDGPKRGAHRVSYEIHYGPIPAGPGYHGTVIRHLCDNPACVNPAHLLSGTHQQNVDDRNRRGRQSRGATHQQGERHSQSKLTNADVLAIRADRRLYREIASDFAIAESTVCCLKRGHRWPHLKQEPTNK
jgi:hypothetical protein